MHVKDEVLVVFVFWGENIKDDTPEISRGERIVKIHGVVWLVLGIFIWFYTSFVEGRMVGGGTLPAFRFFAVIFMLWGGWRLSRDYWIRPKKREQVGPPPRRQHPQPGHGSPHQTHQHVRHPHGSFHQTHQHTRPHQHPGHSAHYSGFKQCPHCHRPVHNQSPICPSCHNRV